MSESNADRSVQDQSTQKEPLKGNETARTEIHKAIFADLGAYGVYPTALIQGGKEFSDLAPRATAEIRNRPFLIMQVADSNGESQIYKRRMEDDPRESANNESFVLQSILPKIMAQFPQQLRDIIRFPVLRGRHADQRSFVEEYFQGKIMGDVHKASSDLFTVNDLHAIADVIKIIQAQGGKWIADPNLHLQGTTERKVYEKYKPDLQRRETRLRKTLGNEKYEQLMLLFKDQETLLSSEKVFLAAGDIQASNIIKMENGQLGMIDWERVKATNSPALDYCFMYAVLWENPQLQEEYLQYVLSQNQDIPNFKEYFRLDLIFNRGTGELNHWWDQLQEAKTPDEKAECEKAIERYTFLLGNAMDKKGVWGDKQTQINNAVVKEVMTASVTR